LERMGVGTQLTTDERQRALVAHAKVMRDKLWVTSSFELQSICAEIALQPTLEEIDEALSANGGKVDFAGLLNFVRDMKDTYLRPEPRDADTVGAFVAVGGAHDKTGTVDADVLRQACRRFSLTVDGMLDSPGDAVLPAPDSPAPPPMPSEQGDMQALHFQDFRSLLSPSGNERAVAQPDEDRNAYRPLELGIDFKQLVDREQQSDIANQAAPARRKSTTRAERGHRRSITATTAVHAIRAAVAVGGQAASEDRFPPFPLRTRTPCG